jgi:hypothetical protein
MGFGSRLRFLLAPLHLFGSPPLHVEHLLELFGQAGAHSRPCPRLRVAIPSLFTGRLGGRKLVLVHSIWLSIWLQAPDHVRATCYDPEQMELYGVRIPTIVTDNVAARCDGCGEIIEGRPWRISILDVVAPEAPVSWTESAGLNPGPFEFHSEPSHVLTWMSARGLLFFRRSQVREIMRPVWLPVEPRRLGLCDGLHRDDHEFVDPAAVAADRS